jgi:hypothetical protein
MIEGVVHVLCFENGAELAWLRPLGRVGWCSTVLAVFIDLDWFRATLFRPTFEPHAEANLLAYPRAGFEARYYVLSREDVAHVAAGLQALLLDPLPTEIAALLATRAEQLHARHAEEISTVKEAMTALLRQHPDLLKPDDVQRSHRCLSQWLSGPHPGHWASDRGAGK